MLKTFFAPINTTREVRSETLASLRYLRPVLTKIWMIRHMALMLLRANRQADEQSGMLGDINRCEEWTGFFIWLRVAFNGCDL
jgi:hypothetical protein